MDSDWKCQVSTNKSWMLVAFLVECVEAECPDGGRRNVQLDKTRSPHQRILRHANYRVKTDEFVSLYDRPVVAERKLDTPQKLAAAISFVRKTRGKKSRNMKWVHISRRKGGKDCGGRGVGCSVEPWEHGAPNRAAMGPSRFTLKLIWGTVSRWWLHAERRKTDLLKCPFTACLGEPLDWRDGASEPRRAQHLLTFTQAILRVSLRSRAINWTE